MRTLMWLAAVAGAAAAGDFDSRLELDEFRLVAVQEGGRKKPLDTFAREQLEIITGSPVWHGEDPVATVLSMVFEPQKWETVEMFRVGHPDLVALLDRKRDGDLRKVFSYRELVEHGGLREEIQRRAQSEGRAGGAREKAVDGLVAKMRAFASLETRLAVLPPPPGYPMDDWYAFVEGAGGAWTAAGAPRALYPGGWLEETEKSWGEAVASLRGRDAAAANRALGAMAGRLAAVNPGTYPDRSRLAVEHAFLAWQPFRVAWIAYLAACVFLALSFRPGAGKLQAAGFGFLCAGFACHLAGVGMRAYVAQRAPWADFYETLVVATLMCTALALVLEAVHRSACVGLAAASLSCAGLVGASMLPFDFRTLNPLMPVLRSWCLKYHVLAMTASYGAFTLAFGISAMHLFMHYVKHDVEISGKLEKLAFQAIQVGFFSLTVGAVLGAVWADSAWGRYWGWDPKEIWALVSWCVYGAYLCGRTVGWCRGPRAAYASLIGFCAILFTFLGVNFVLTGLHSYANPT